MLNNRSFDESNVVSTRYALGCRTLYMDHILSWNLPHGLVVGSYLN